MSGPFSTPLALARDPITAALLVFAAPIVVPVILVTLLAAAFGQGVLAASTSWTVMCVAAAVQFALVSTWSERIGAGAFAGRIRAGQGWFLAAVFLGPFILHVPFLVFDLVLGGQGNWVFREGVDPQTFAKPNWTLSFIVYAVLLAPVVEEVTYRGVAMGALLARGVPAVLAAVVSSFAFALPHMQYSFSGMVAVFVTGLGFAGLRLASGTVTVPILAHMAANGSSFLLQG